MSKKRKPIGARKVLKHFERGTDNEVHRVIRQPGRRKEWHTEDGRAVAEVEIRWV